MVMIKDETQFGLITRNSNIFWVNLVLRLVEHHVQETLTLTLTLTLLT